MVDYESVRGKVAIVTGAAHGIGEAIAKCYGANGLKVVCSDLDQTVGKRVADSICENGGTAVFHQADSSKADEVEALVACAVSHYQRLDGIVNNAGIGMGGVPTHEYSMDDFEKISNINIRGVFAGMKYGAEAIFKSRSTGGFIINIASVAGLMPQRGQALYTATKHAVVGLSKTAALDYAPHNITVNAICPGYTLTSIFSQAPAQALNLFIQDSPSGRMGKPEECAYLALFLASDMARFITGAAIPVDGALSAGFQNIITWQHPEVRNGVDGFE